MALVGVGVGTTFAALPGPHRARRAAEETGSAMGFYQVSRFIGFALGIGLAVTFLRASAMTGDPTLAVIQVDRTRSSSGWVSSPRW